MKVALAQTKPISGHIEDNIHDHLRFVDAAVSETAEIIFFPELSISGYEPSMASTLAMSLEDNRLSILQQRSTQFNITIVIGAPLLVNDRIRIGQVVFSPDGSKSANFKSYLHPDEEPYFTAGESCSPLTIGTTRIGLAICYEISVTVHRDKIFENKINMYVASVAKSAKGIPVALGTISETAQRYHVPSLMCNSIGLQDGMVCAGSSSVWDATGRVIEQLDAEQTGLLLYDTESESTKLLYF